MKLIQVTEAAERIGVSRQTLENWGKNGTLRIRTMGKTGNAHWVDADTIDELGDTMQEVEHAREMLKKELADIQSEYRKERDLLRDLRREVMMIGKFGSGVDKKEFYLHIPIMLCELGILKEREARIMCMVINGDDIGWIAEQYGLTRSRIAQIFYKGCRKASYLENIKAHLDEFERMKIDNAELKGCVKTLRQELEAYRKAEQDLKDMNTAEYIEDIKKKDEMLKLFGTRLVDCDISVRALNCLRYYRDLEGSKDIETIGDLCKLHKTDLLKQRNFGKKSLIELDDFLEDRGLSFGMDVDRIYRERIMERIEDEDMKQALEEGNQI